MFRPIHTYSGQATLKYNLPEPRQHAIIYTSASPPPEHFYTLDNGTVVSENLTKSPIKVVREQQGPEGDLGTKARINYSKIYTVENYVRVLNIGVVDDESLPNLMQNSFVKPRETPIERPRRSNVREDDRKGKDKREERGKKWSERRMR
jgi:hypothetical protein